MGRLLMPTRPVRSLKHEHALELLEALADASEVYQRLLTRHWDSEEASEELRDARDAYYTALRRARSLVRQEW